MGRWTREELEEAFDLYQKTALAAGTSGDWRAWADMFTEDATYIEHHYGEFGGREAIYEWIQTTMSEPIIRDMRYFPIDWYTIDEDRGWIIAKVWNRMVDPGDGSIHQEHNITILRYAGNMKWSYEEDVYNPAHFAKMIEGWMARKKEVEAKKKQAAESQAARSTTPSRAREDARPTNQEASWRTRSTDVPSVPAGSRLSADGCDERPAWPSMHPALPPARGGEVRA